MTTVAEKVESIVSDLNTQREEVIAKINLEQPDLKSKWSEIEAKWQQIKEKQKKLSYSVGKSTLALG